MKKKVRLLWIIDPWNSLDHAQDTTLRLAEEAMLLGAECFFTDNRSISLRNGKVEVEGYKIRKMSRPRTTENIQRGPARWINLTSFQHIFYRVDPPIDLRYLLPLQLLAKDAPRIHSPPSTLFGLNEKWAPTALGNFFPKSLVSASSKLLLDFIDHHGKVVLKPLYQAQSKGVIILEKNVLSAGSLRARLSTATEAGKIPVILQEYLPGILKGETRLWFTNGRLIASIRKIPKAGESIIDMDRGGRLAKAPLTTSEKRAALAVGKYLKKNRILWAAVDLIDGKITDFNHTSPGLIVAMEALLGKNLAREALRPIISGDLIGA